ncbi:MAG: hypothetical protein HAW60_03480 [Bdellovibrionales bacterium]|nr:hypothetical protein [Bdellovibrionales bacterium]
MFVKALFFILFFSISSQSLAQSCVSLFQGSDSSNNSFENLSIENLLQYMPKDRLLMYNGNIFIGHHFAESTKKQKDFRIQPWAEQNSVNTSFKYHPSGASSKLLKELFKDGKDLYRGATVSEITFYQILRDFLWPNRNSKPLRDIYSRKLDSSFFTEGVENKKAKRAIKKIISIVFSKKYFYNNLSFEKREALALKAVMAYGQQNKAIFFSNSKKAGKEWGRYSESRNKIKKFIFESSGAVVKFPVSVVKELPQLPYVGMEYFTRNYIEVGIFDAKSRLEIIKHLELH